MKNCTKFFQALILVLLWCGAQAQVATVKTPADNPGNTNATADVDVSGAQTTATIYTPTGNRAPLASLYDNGPLFNSTGTGTGGANESIYYQGGLGTFGTGCQYVVGYSIADDFVIPSGLNWNITSMDFFSYQTNSTTTSTLTGIYVRIWSGKPGVAGSTVVWGDIITNRMGVTSFTNVYRTVAVSGGSARPIMKVVANTPGLSLNTGTYWVEWSCTGSLSSGPWAPPVVTVNNVTGNAIQSLDAGVTFNEVAYNGYAQGFPFVVNGTSISTVPAMSTWGLILLGAFILGIGIYFGYFRTT